MNDADDVQLESGTGPADTDEVVVASAAPADANSDTAGTDSDDSDRVFDITDDLTISPVKEPVNDAADHRVPPTSSYAPRSKNLLEEYPPVTQKPILADIRPAPAPIAVKSPPANLPGADALPTPPIPPVTVPQKSIGSIPLQDITGSLAKARTAPANPEAKKLENVNEIKGQTQPSPFTAQPDDAGLKRLRTYEGDVAEIMAHKKTSVASIAIAEKEKNEVMPEQEGEAMQQTQTAKPSSHTGLKITVVILSILFIAAGGIGAYYLYTKSPLAPSDSPLPPEETPSSSLIPAQSQVAISTSGLDPLTIANRIRTEAAKSQNPDTIREIVLTKNTGGRVTRITGPEMITLMDIEAPDILVRSLTAPWMLGVYTDEMNQPHVFTAVTTNFFQNAFAGMLQWEEVMADDLKQYLSSQPVRGIANVSNQATSTNTVTGTMGTSSTQPTPEPAPAAYFTLRGHFEDRIVMNKDVRAFRTETGSILFLYSFINNSTLVVTTDEKTLAEILQQLEQQAFVR